MDKKLLIPHVVSVERRIKRNCPRNIWLKLVLPIVVNISITIAIILLWPNCKLVSEETEFLFKIEATHEWFPDGIKGDNITGYPFMIVPNIVHYVMLEDHKVSFVHYISVKSILRHQKPDEIMFHCDCEHLQGEYWQRIKSESSGTKITVRRVKRQTTIFGRRIRSEWINWHGSDIIRNKVLMKYGGIYLDNDVYVTKSLDPLRKYEMTVDVPNDNIGSQLLIGHKNARFLRLYLQTYMEYDPYQWYYNAGTLPYQKIVLNYPHLVHAVSNEFGCIGSVMCPKLYRQNINDWREKYYAIHLLMRGNTVNRLWCDIPDDMSFDEQNIKSANITFGQMVRLLLYDTTDLIH